MGSPNIAEIAFCYSDRCFDGMLLMPNIINKVIKYIIYCS